MFFACYIILFRKEIRKTMEGFKDELDMFCSFSGMVMNQRKSGVAFSKVVSNREELLGVWGDLVPIKYLGLPLIYNKLQHLECSSLLQSLDKILSRWHGYNLSYACMSQLLNWVFLWKCDLLGTKCVVAEEDVEEDQKPGL